MAKSLSILIPVYNEEENIERAIMECEKKLAQLNINSEIIAVNDGSRDRSGELLEELAQYRDYLKVYHHTRNRGIGAAIRTAFHNANYDSLFVFHADLQFDIAEIDNFLSAAQNAEIVLGRVANEKFDYNWYRRLNSTGNRFLLRLLFGLNYENPNWVKLLHRSVLEEIPIVFDGFFWDSALIIQAKKAGYNISEAPAHYHKRNAGEASGSSPIRVLRTFFEMMLFWLKQLFGIK